MKQCCYYKDEAMLLQRCAAALRNFPIRNSRLARYINTYMCIYVYIYIYTTVVVHALERVLVKVLVLVLATGTKY